MIHTTSLLLVFTSIVSALIVPRATNPSSILTSDIDDFIQNIISEWGSPGGVAVAAVKMNDDGSWVVDAKGYGRAKADGTSVDASTMFGVGSTSKQFTAIAAGLLMANESLSPRLTTKTKIASIFPDSWELMDAIATSQSTIVDLFSHRTGIPRHDNCYALNDTVAVMMSKMKHLRPSLEFRDAFQYSNIGYAILSYLPTTLLPSKIPFARYVKEHLLDPLGLNATYSPEVASQGHVLAQGFQRDNRNLTSVDTLFDMGTPRALEYWSEGVTEDGNAMSGAGGLIMNAYSAAVWLQTMLLDGVNPSNGERVFPSDIITQISTGISVAAGSNVPILYGAGQELTTYRGTSVVGHEGDVIGFHASMTRIPSLNMGVAILTNDDVYGPYYRDVLKYRIMDAMLGLEPMDWNTIYKQSIEQAFTASLGRLSSPSDASDPSAPYADHAGLFNNPGYGNVDFCYISDSAACADILATIPNVITGEVPTLIARWDKLWASHVSLQHFDGDTWNATMLLTRPVLNDTNGLRTDGLWTAKGNSFTVKFAFDSAGQVAGMGFFGGFWGAPSPSVANGDDISEVSEVWFDKSG